MTNLRVAQSKTARRQQVLMEGQGYFAETCPRSAISNVSIATDGFVYGSSIGLAVGDVVSNLTILVSTAGTGMTIAKLGLYAKTGNTLLASSADQSSAFNSTGMKTAAMTAPYTVTADDLYYAVFFGKTATTMPTMYRALGNAVTTSHNGIGSGSGFVVLQVGQTDLPTPATLTVNSAAVCYWIAAS